MQKNKYSKRITIVIIIHNSAKVIGKCLASIPPLMKVIVVDNASSDSSIEIVKCARPDAIIIKSQVNIGFGGGNNLALAVVKTEFAFALNPDTIMHADTIENLLITADKYQDAAIISPIMFFEDGTIQKTYKNSVFSRESGKSKYIVPEGDLCADFLSGAAMLFRMKLFRKIGFFDPEIFLFYEDDDICLKVRKAGYSLVQTPTASLIHLMGKSSPPSLKYIYIKNWHIMWSRLYLERKYRGEAEAKTLAMKEMLLQFGKSIGHLFMLDNKKIIKSIARMVAIISFTIGIPAIRNKS